MPSPNKIHLIPYLPCGIDRITNQILCKLNDKKEEDEEEVATFARTNMGGETDLAWPPFFSTHPRTIMKLRRCNVQAVQMATLPNPVLMHCSYLILNVS